MYRYDYNLKLLRETPETILSDFEADSAKVKTIIADVAGRKGVLLQLNEAIEILNIYGIPAVETIKVQKRSGCRCHGTQARLSVCIDARP